MNNNIFSIKYFTEFTSKFFKNNFYYVKKNYKLLQEILKKYINSLIELSKKDQEIINLFVDLYFSPETYCDIQNLIQTYFDKIAIENIEIKNYLIHSIKNTLNFFLYSDPQAIYLVKKYNNENNCNFNELQLNFINDLINLKEDEIKNKYNIYKNSNLSKFLTAFSELYNKKYNQLNFEKKVSEFYKNYLLKILSNFSFTVDIEKINFVSSIIKIFSNSINSKMYLSEIIEKLTNSNNNFIMTKIISDILQNCELKEELIQKVKNISINFFSKLENKIKNLWIKYIDYIENFEIEDLENKKYFIIYSKKYIFIQSSMLKIYITYNNEEFKDIRINLRKINNLKKNKFSSLYILGIQFLFNFYVKKYLEESV